MIEHRILFGATLGAALLPAAAKTQGAPAAGRLTEPGPENDAMARRAGLWDMMETVWESPGAAPVVTTGNSPGTYESPT